MSEEKKPGIQERSVESSLLAKYLRSVEVGELVPYSKLVEISGANSWSELQKRSYLRTARKIVQEEDNVVFETVRNEGLRRATASKTIDIGNRSVSRIGREARRGSKVLRCVEYENLSNIDKTRFNVAVSQVGFLSAITKSGATKKIESAVEKKQEQLPLGKMLDAFRGKVDDNSPENT